MISPVYYDQNQVIPSSVLQLNCIKCNTIDNISVSNSLDQYSLQNLVGSFLCRQCLYKQNKPNYNTNDIKFQNKRGHKNNNNLSILKEDFNQFKEYSIDFNNKQFNKILKEVNLNSVNITALLNFKDRDKIRRRSDDLNLKLKLLELKKVIGEMIDNLKGSIEEKNNFKINEKYIIFENKIKEEKFEIDDKYNKFENIINQIKEEQSEMIDIVNKKSEIDDKYKTFENVINKIEVEKSEIIDTVNKKSKIVSKQYEKSIKLINLLGNRMRKTEDDILAVKDDINSVNSKIDENKELLIFTSEEIINKSAINFKEFENELDSLSTEIKSQKFSSKEIKEIKNLKHHLILNDKEYRKVKQDLNNFNEGIKFIYAFIILNIISILSFIIHTIVFYKID